MKNSTHCRTVSPKAALSHAAVVAREYVPAILGAGLTTMRFKDGEMIRVNGSEIEETKVG